MLSKSRRWDGQKIKYWATVRPGFLNGHYYIVKADMFSLLGFVSLIPGVHIAWM
jgi:hypothetical protein